MDRPRVSDVYWLRGHGSVLQLSAWFGDIFYGECFRFRKDCKKKMFFLHSRFTKACFTVSASFKRARRQFLHKVDGKLNAFVPDFSVSSGQIDPKFPFFETLCNPPIAPLTVTDLDLLLVWWQWALRDPVDGLKRVEQVFPGFPTCADLRHLVAEYIVL